MKTIKAFSEQNIFEFINAQKQFIIKSVNHQAKAFFLTGNKDEYIKRLYEEVALKPLSVDLAQQPSIQYQATKKRLTNYLHGEDAIIDAYNCRLTYTFKGSYEIFYIIPNPRKSITYDIIIDPNSSTVSFDFVIIQKDKNVFDTTKQRILAQAFGNLQAANENIIHWNEEIPIFIEHRFFDRKEYFLEDDVFFNSLNDAGQQK